MGRIREICGELAQSESSEGASGEDPSGLGRSAELGERCAALGRELGPAIRQVRAIQHELRSTRACLATHAGKQASSQHDLVLELAGELYDSVLFVADFERWSVSQVRGGLDGSELTGERVLDRPREVARAVLRDPAIDVDGLARAVRAEAAHAGRIEAGRSPGAGASLASPLIRYSPP